MSKQWRPEMHSRMNPEVFAFLPDAVRDWIDEASANGCDIELECEHREVGQGEMRRIVR